MAGLPQEGQPFGRYDIRRRIGRGGMGVVYAAVQRGLGREVALKVLSSDYADNEEYRTRFLREAEILARLDSPHIIQVHDAGEQDGWLYIATQLVPDGDLHVMLNSFGPMPIGLALDVTAQIADGISAAHRAGIIHRDIKPSNVLLRNQGGGKMQAYVCDLGISRALDSQHTNTQGVIGTFAYMAPERHEGKTATEASDIYALGCLLWATLSGSAPFVGTDSQVLLGHLSGDIPQLERPDAIGSRINELLRRTMAKDPIDRHASADDFASDCQSILGALAGNPEIARAEAATRTPSNRPPAGDMVQPSSFAPQQIGPQQFGQQQFDQQQFDQQDQFQPGPQQGQSHPSQPAPMAFASSPAGAQQWDGQGGPNGPDHPYPTNQPQPPSQPRQPGKGKALLIASIVLAVVVVFGGVTAFVLTLGDDGGDASVGTDKSSQAAGSDSPGTEAPDTESADTESAETGGPSGNADIHADVSSSPTDADQGKFCAAFRDFNFNAEYVEGRKKIGNLIEIGTPADLISSERAGYEKFVTIVQDSKTETEFLDQFSKLSPTEGQNVTAFNEYTVDNC